MSPKNILMTVMISNPRDSVEVRERERKKGEVESTFNAVSFELTVHRRPQDNVEAKGKRNNDEAINRQKLDKGPNNLEEDVRGVARGVAHKASQKRGLRRKKKFPSSVWDENYCKGFSTTRGTPYQTNPAGGDSEGDHFPRLARNTPRIQQDADTARNRPKVGKHLREISNIQEKGKFPVPWLEKPFPRRGTPVQPPRNPLMIAVRRGCI